MTPNDTTQSPASRHLQKMRTDESTSLLPSPSSCGSFLCGWCLSLVSSSWTCCWCCPCWYRPSAVAPSGDTRPELHHRPQSFHSAPQSNCRQSRRVTFASPVSQWINALEALISPHIAPILCRRLTFPRTCHVHVPLRTSGIAEAFSSRSRVDSYRFFDLRMCSHEASCHFFFRGCLNAIKELRYTDRGHSRGCTSDFTGDLNPVCPAGGYRPLLTLEHIACSPNQDVSNATINP
ncbi:uncharacterized protein AUP68_17492 [Ilyonectria robusta]